MKMIKSYIKDDKTEWDLYLGCLAAVYRSNVHETTGLTPNLLMLGREVRIPSEIVFDSKTCYRDQSVSEYGDYLGKLRDRLQTSYCIARKNLQSAHRRQRDFYNLKTSVNSYKEGDPVWFLNEGRKDGKMSDLYWGPCTIVQKFSDITFKIQNPTNGSYKVVYHDKLKPY